MLRRINGYALCIILGIFLWPVVSFAQIVVDAAAPANQKSTISTASDGVSVVNIQTPTDQGVSHNTFSQFDVDEHGVILNNASNDIQTKLSRSDWVKSNPLLANEVARTILIEVVSGVPTSIKGPIEVADSHGRIIISNPSGIICEGCSFVNANRVTLTTGELILDGCYLNGFRVQGGKIKIAGKGMIADFVDSVDLIACDIDMDLKVGMVKAEAINIITGTKEINFDNTVRTPIVGKDGTEIQEGSLVIKGTSNMGGGRIIGDNVSITAHEINNSNANFSVREEEVAREHIQYATPRIDTGDYREWTVYNYDRVTTETRLLNSNPSQIISGHSMTIKADRFINDKSMVVAGGEINSQIGELVNQELKGKRVTTCQGSAVRHQEVRHKHSPFGPPVWTSRNTSVALPAPIVEEFTLIPAVFQENVEHRDTKGS